MTLPIYPSLSPIDPVTGQNMGQAVEFVSPPYSCGYNPQAGQIYVFPFTLDANTRVVFNTMHTDIKRQDYTLYAWFSSEPLVPVLFYPDRVYEISLVRRNRSFSIQDINYKGTNVPNPLIPIIYAEPCTYYFQVGNRTNYENKFEFLNQIIPLT